MKILFMLLFAHGMMYAQSESGNTERQMLLDSVIVRSRIQGTTLRTTQNGTLLWDMQMMNDMPKILGNADPLHYAQMLPGVSTNGEYDAGFRVLGNENCHNYISINGIPLYGASHILGLFSVFNASHFRQMHLQKSIASGASANRLGATVDMQTYITRPDSVTGELAVGLISSQGTIRIPVTKHSHLTASLRTSYINLLYSSFLDSDDTSTKYSFYDTNINYLHQIDSNNTLSFDFYLGSDNAKVLDKVGSNNMKLKWENMMSSIKWAYDNGSIHTTDAIYYTRTTSDGGYDTDGIDSSLPSSISEFGNKFSLSCKGWTTGFDVSFYNIEPQSPDVKTSYNHIKHSKDITHTTELSAYLDKSFTMAKGLTLSPGIRASLYHTPHDNFTRLSPMVNVTYEHPSGWDVTLNYSLRHQYLVQTGMSSLNTPMEFWISSGMYGLKPQSSHGVTLTGRYATKDGCYSATIELYNRWLRNQVEYNGTIYSFLSTSDYNLSNMLLRGKGHNYGADIILAKNKGFITGWLSYAYGKALRTYDTEALRGTFPSSHERLHEVNAVIVLHPGKRWDIGVTGVWATGTPFTAPEYYYILQNRLIPHFARHNSNRLRPYYRIDASANYRFNSKRIREHGMNLSVYNITGHKNDLFHYMSADEKYFRYKSMTFAIRVMPSISYYMKF